MKFVNSSLVALILALTAFGLVSASYTGPNRTVTTTTWERQYCNYRATITSPSGTCFLTLYFSPGSCPSPSSVANYFNNAPTACGTSWPGICGAGLSCNIALLTDSTESCSSGETGCTQSTNTSTYPPATVSGTTVCAVPGNNSWCRGTATINLSGNEPMGGYNITGIESSTGLLCSGAACSWTFPEGTTNLNFWALSSWGDTSTMASASMSVDSLAPALTLTIPPADGLNGWFVSGPVFASASATDLTSGVSGSASINGGGSSFIASADGTSNLAAVVSDIAGNTASTNGTIRLDTTPPTFSVSVPPVNGLNGWHILPLTLTGSGSDTTSGLAAIRYRVGGGAWTFGESLSVPEGMHGIEFQASDAAGNNITIANTISLDTTPPSLSISVPPVDGSNGWYKSPVTLTASGSDATSGLAAMSSRLDGGTWTADATVNIPEGVHGIEFQASDVAGNRATISKTISLDTTPPSLSISVPPVNGSNGWYISPVTLTASGTDTTSGLATMRYRVDGGAWTTGATVNIPEGVHGIEFQARDVAGNSTTISKTISLDTIPPSLSVSVPPVNGSNGWYISPVTLTASGSDITSGLMAMRYRLDNGAWTSGSSVSIPEGVHEIEFQASDAAGNLTSNSHTLSVDTTPPTITISLPAPQGKAGWYTSSLQFQAAGNDTISGVQGIAFSLDGGVTWQAGPVSLVEGRYTITTRVTDRAGNVTTSMNTVNVDPTPPQSTFTLPAEGTTTVINGNFNMNGQTLDLTSGPATAEISMDGGTTWLPLAIFSGNWSTTWDTNAVPNGTYTIQVRASDVAGNKERTAQITLVVANQGPEVSITQTWWLWEQAKVTLQANILPVTGARITISDGQGHTRTYNFDAGNLPSNLKWDGRWSDGLFAPSGDFAVLVTAWDAFGNTGRATGTVRIPLPQPTPTRDPSPLPTQTSEAIPPAATTDLPSIIPQGMVTAPAPRPAPVPGPAKLQGSPKPPTIDPVYIWPVIGLVGLLAVFSSASWSDKRPSALHRLERLLTKAASRREETKK